MNNYNENLHNSILASLQSQELDQKKVASEGNASMFSLYYAEGATITATEKLTAAKADQEKKALVKEQAVKNSNISNNLTSSANHSGQYVKQSITNTAVCASNVQIAANSIVKLASDLGSIYSIVNAANFETDIYTHTKEARELINDTARDAEVASKLAMEASISISEVSSSTVADKAKSTNDTMNSLLKVASDDFNSALQIVSTDNDIVASVSAKEKLAEGDYEDLSIDYTSSESAYGLTNKELNLDLKAFPKPGHENSAFIVKFNFIHIPKFENVKVDQKEMTRIKNELNYPVQHYYVIVVKDSKKATFSIANAENIILNKESQFIRVPNLPETIQEKREQNHGITVEPSNGGINLNVNYYSMQVPGDARIYTLKDSDGEEIALGKKYVVFIMAAFYEDYKKKLNTFDDFLSAPSTSFTLTNHIREVKGQNIKVHKIHEEDKKKGENKHKGNSRIENEVKPTDTYQFTFSIPEIQHYSVEYRCMFLPKSDGLTNGLLNNTSLKEFKDDIKHLEDIADEFDPKIAKQEALLTQLNLQLEKTPAKTKTGDGKNNKDNHKNNEGIVDSDLTFSDPAELPKQIESTKKTLHDLVTQKNRAMSEISKYENSKIDFLFNLTLAEQVLAGNYIPIEFPPVPSPTAGKHSHENLDFTKPIDFVVTFGPEITDNFGNSLIDGNHYLPVVVSVSTAEEENIPMFTNSWSDYVNSPDFIYQSIVK